jgi:hypothetical protein
MRGIKEALQPQYRLAAEEKYKAINFEEDGADVAAELWNKHMLHCNGYRPPCSILPTRAAVWSVSTMPSVKLSALAAHILIREDLLRYKDLELLQIRRWEIFETLGRPMTPNNAEADIVKQKRIAQGAFDFDSRAEIDRSNPHSTVTSEELDTRRMTKEISQGR